MIISSASDQLSDAADTTAGERIDVRNSAGSYPVDDLIVDLRKYPMLSTPQWAADRLGMVSRLWRELSSILIPLDDRAIELIECMDIALSPAVKESTAE